MGPEAVHMAVALRYAAVAHDDCDLMERFRNLRPEIPLIGVGVKVRPGIALHDMVEVGELERITQKEDRRVVSDQVPVAFLGIKLDGEASDIALGICCAALARNG